MTMRLLAPVLALALASPDISLALQARDTPADTPATAERCSLTIVTDIDSAIVYLDSVCAGKTPLTVDSLRAGAHVIRVLHPAVSSWLTGDVMDTVVLSPGTSRRVRFRLPVSYGILTEPFGASVVAGDSVLGTTPLYIRTDLIRAGTPLRLEMQGFDTALVDPSREPGGIAKVILTKIWGSTWEGGSLFKRSDDFAPGRFKAYASAGVTILAGAAAAYFKVRADDQYQSYLATNNPALLHETHRLDTASAISLAVAEVGMAVFMYFFLSE